MGTQAIYTWLPSTARVVLIDGFGMIPRGTLPLPAIPPSWPPKDPTDILDFVIDISGAIAGNEGDSIATIDVVVSPNNTGDLTLLSSSANGDAAILWFSDGFGGTTYQVTVTIGTNSGRIIGRDDQSSGRFVGRAPPFPPEALTDQTGAPITDQTNTPILVTD